MNLSTRLMQLEETQRIVRKQLPHQVSDLIKKYSQENDVHFKIDSNYVYLYGVIEDPKTKKTLHDEIDALVGVRGISNEIRIKTR